MCVILLVAGDATAISDSAPTGRETTVASVAEAKRLLEEADPFPRLVVVDLRLDGAADVVRALRRGEYDDPLCPLVVRTGAGAPDVGDLPLLSIDAVVDDGSPGTLDEAVERGLRVSDYREAVTRLYEECTARARSGETDPLAEPPTLADARADADELLAALADDGLVLSDLLWNPSPEE